MIKKNFIPASPGKAGAYVGVLVTGRKAGRTSPFDTDSCANVGIQPSLRHLCCCPNRMAKQQIGREDIHTPCRVMGEACRRSVWHLMKSHVRRPLRGMRRLIGDRLVFQRLDALLDESDATGLIGNTFDQHEIGLILREGPFRIRGLVGLSQVVTGNGIVGAKRDGFFE